jgi:ubiquinone biosynthesis protein UbiJ
MGVRVSNVVKGVLDFGKKFKDSLVRNTSEYLVEESRDLIAPAEMEDFLDDVDDLKADTARLEQQINALRT